MELFCCAQSHPLNVRVPVFGWSAPPHASFRMTIFRDPLHRDPCFRGDWIHSTRTQYAPRVALPSARRLYPMLELRCADGTHTLHSWFECGLSDALWPALDAHALPGAAYACRLPVLTSPLSARFYLHADFSCALLVDGIVCLRSVPGEQTAADLTHLLTPGLCTLTLSPLRPAKTASMRALLILRTMRGTLYSLPLTPQWDGRALPLAEQKSRP